MIISDLLKGLQTPPRELSCAVTILQSILLRDDTVQSVKHTTKTKSTTRLEPITANTNTRLSISTIIHKRFDDGIFHEGSIILYDSVNNFYMVKFKDGNREEYMYDGVQKCTLDQMNSN